MNDMATIELINNASFLITHGPVQLICDPSIEGAVFDGSWNLLAESRFPKTLLGRSGQLATNDKSKFVRTVSISFNRMQQSSEIK